MNMQQDLETNSKAEKLEWALLALFSFAMLLVVIGIISQSQGVNRDTLLVPSFFLSGGLFFVLFGTNGLTNGKLVEKWTPYVLRAWIKGITRLFIASSIDREKDAWKLTLGMIALIVGGGCIATGLYDLYKHF